MCLYQHYGIKKNVNVDPLYYNTEYVQPHTLWCIAKNQIYNAQQQKKKTIFLSCIYFNNNFTISSGAHRNIMENCLSKILYPIPGYAHSFLNPILYWILNHNTLRQSSSCAPFLRLAAVQRFIRVRLRVPTAPPPPSSTNEAALGPFNPRYIKARPQQYRPPASSMNLY